MSKSNVGSAKARSKGYTYHKIKNLNSSHLGQCGDATSRNQPKCNPSIYDYMPLVVICN